jgi:hypothetical protein
VIDLSIIIVNYNTRRMTLDCLESVYANLGNLSAEIILIDNASTDGSVEDVQTRFPDTHVICNAENRGFATANNLGFAIATGRHVLLLNSDTIVRGQVLAASVAYMDDRPDVGAMGCRVLNTDGSLQHTCTSYPSLLNLTLLCVGLDRLKPFDRYRLTRWARDNERDVDIVSGCYLLVRREVIEKVGGLDEAFFFYGEETDWARRIRKAGWRLRFAPVGEIVHHGSGSARKLSHRRDVWLTSGLVRLHRKHDGLLAAIGAWTVLAMHNLLRLLIWSVLGILPQSAAARARCRHFAAVLANFTSAWPRQIAEVSRG